MHCYFNTFSDRAICSTISKCYCALHHLYRAYSNIHLWGKDLDAIFEMLFQREPTFKKIRAIDTLRHGAVFLWVIYAGQTLLRETSYPPVPSPDLKRRNLDWDDLKAQTLVAKLRFLPKYLTQREIVYPYRFLRKFYQRGDCASWATHWNTLIEAAISRNSLEEDQKVEEHLTRCLYFRKLLEANYLLHVRNFGSTAPEAYEAWTWIALNPS